ncbi:phage terminase large subunit [Singulisphaera acidiphila]|uniref:Phage terminase large subunit n=1 Tax=Singulisphaera acidiphila (strain ATCC BAA-1392 / DSM 18658 / VKM B-2454 / MOB10) TaxID=886293 RepID=L0DHW5_SINAD|nr:phage terminase large subunit [Singulisphaera acidiphila]AGA28393.1 phage terminase large subunit [Singulisphaera acidiphila DSM 18658]
MITPANRPYEPFGAAKDVWTDRSDEVLLSGPAGTGKSRACLEKLHAVCLRWPGARCLIVRKTRESLTETALVTYEEKVLPANSPIAEGPRRSHRQAYHYPNGSTVVVGGLDKPGKVMSTEYDLIYVQEAIELYENDWEALTTRLRNGVVPFQQIIADTNPDRPTHWLKQRVDRGATVMLESRHEDNPTLWDRTENRWLAQGHAYISKLDRLTGARKPRLRHGKWVQSEGVVYEDWDRQVHIIDPFAIPPSWRRIRAIDFGYANPFVCLWIAIDDDCRMYVYRELYHTKRTVKVHAAQINALSEGESYDFNVADHDAEDRATLLENGIATVHARKDVSPGIEAVQERLKDAGDGRRRLYVFRNCLVERDPSLVEAKKPCSVLEEFDSYSWPKAPDGKAVEEAPEKLYDHGLDALRYATMSIDRGVTAIVPAAVLEARELAEQQAAEAAYRDVNNPLWWG